MKAIIFGSKLQHLLELVSFSKALNADETLVLAVSLTEEEVKEVASYGVTKVYFTDEKEVTTDEIVDGLLKISEIFKPEVVAGPGTRDAYEISSRVGVRLGAPTITEVVGIKMEGGLVFERAAMGGRAISVEEVRTPVTLTISLGRFEPPKEKVEETEIEKVSLKKESKVKLLEVREKSRGGIDITTSQIVVGVGRGFRNKEDIALAQQLANLLGGAVGCSRPIAADYSWLPEDVWIGFSGKKIRPKLYFAIGVSGAAEHMSGVKDAKLIVAINKDGRAPIFTQCDYGIEADLYEFLPILIDKLKQRFLK